MVWIHDATARQASAKVGLSLHSGHPRCRCAAPHGGEALGATRDGLVPGQLGEPRREARRASLGHRFLKFIRSRETGETSSIVIDGEPGVIGGVGRERTVPPGVEAAAGNLENVAENAHRPEGFLHVDESEFTRSPWRKRPSLF